MNEKQNLSKAINVSSVPQRSPFRYPGGKTWLVPYLRNWLRSLPAKPDLFVEPFAGGGIIGLTVGFEELARTVEMAEIDDDVAAVWKTVFGKTDDVNWLCERILSFEVTSANIRAELAETPRTIRQQAFHTILRNRTFHGGILAKGSSLINRGEGGRGVRSRWYPETLRRRMLDIWQIRKRFSFKHQDGFISFENHGSSSNAAFFIDPPYTAGGRGKRAGRRLYTHCQLDHEQLFHCTARLAGDFLMTYDNDEEVIALAQKYGFQTALVAMKNTHHANMQELLIGKNLDWVHKAQNRARQRRLFD